MKDRTVNAAPLQRGFVTIATGREDFYRLAHTLLLSYRMTAEHPLPFAILCDRENQYTAGFDRIVHLDHSTNSWMDKLELLVHAPYDETIFIDADCIAYGDLNRYWDAFSGASDFSAFGYTFPPESGHGWYTREGAGQYGDRISCCMHVHGGVYFIRRGEKCREIYGIARDIAAHYGDYRFKMFNKPADEPILALSMAVTGCAPVERDLGRLIWFVRDRAVQADFFQRKLTYTPRDSSDARTAVLIHFSTGLTHGPLYLIESKKVLYLQRHGHPWSAWRGRVARAECRIQRFTFRARRKIKRLLAAQK